MKFILEFDDEHRQEALMAMNVYKFIFAIDEAYEYCRQKLKYQDGLTEAEELHLEAIMSILQESKNMGDEN